MSSLSRLSPVRFALLMCGAEIFSMTGFAAYTTLLPVLQREWGLSNWEAGLIGGVYYAGYVAATPLLTSLTDRFDPRRIYLVSCLVSVIGAAGFALAAQRLAAALVFGVVLDLAGGNQDRAAWGLAFASIGIFGALSPLARWLYLRRSPGSPNT